MVRWLLKTQDQESKNRRRINAHCLASIKMVGLVHVRRREKRDRKIVEVTDSCFKNYLIQKSPPHGIF